MGFERTERIDRYRLVRVLGRGGMGQVYLAEQDEPVRRQVALKVMHSDLTDEASIARLRTERRALARLEHPGIARMFDGGETDAGVPYYVMEYVPGARSLIQYAEECAFEIDERLEPFAQVCDAVQHGHERGVLHRDLKPSNILVDSSGRAKVIDYGLARLAGEDAESRLTRTGDVIGTVTYLAPEQCRADGKGVDERSDVYALGVVLYELLTGELPYDLSDRPVVAALRVIETAGPRRPSTIHSRLAGDLEAILLKALAKHPANRYRSPAELSSDLRRHLAGEPVSARREQRTRRAARWGVAALAVALVLFAARSIPSTEAANDARFAVLLSAQKISDDSGGFLEDLSNGGAFGAGVAALGDLDGDGVGDLAVGAARSSDQGRESGAAWILFLTPDGQVKSERKLGADDLGEPLAPGDHFGTGMASVGDLDGNGFTDLAVGASQPGNPDGDGAVWVLLMERDGVVKSATRITDVVGGFGGRADIGNSLAAAGDVNGDGVGDLLVGAPDAAPTGRRDAVWIFFLSPDGRAQHRVEIPVPPAEPGEPETDRFAGAVASPGDLDQDGVPELVTSQLIMDRPGRLWIHFMRRDGTVRELRRVSAGESGFDGEVRFPDVFGSALAATGDLNGDGVGDLAVGAMLDADDERAPGSIWLLFLGRDGQVLGHRKLTAAEAGVPASSQLTGFAEALSGLGDQNGDGFPDLAVGAMIDPGGGFGRGAVHLLFLGGLQAKPAE